MLLLTGCPTSGSIGSNAAPVRSEPVAEPGSDPVLVGAGDIASCSSEGDEATADLLDTIPGTVFTAGDNAYPRGTRKQFDSCYEASWGRHLARTKPAPGNHEYMTRGGAGYYGYFGEAAGDPAKGYYTYELEGWHVVVLNSNCASVGGCGAGSPQERWLREDLESFTGDCTVAYWHHPLFSSGVEHGSDPTVLPLFQALYDHGAEVVIAGHEHNYERFAPQNPAGQTDEERGIRQFVAGMGGASHYGFGSILPTSEARNSDTFGVLKLTLHEEGYDWEFVGEEGRTFKDSGSANCH